MSERAITLHTFSSVKGGVGKSTLAITCAKLLAVSKRAPVLIDCDLTGTSLADGLRLQAPDIASLADGSLDFRSAPAVKPHLSVEETRRLRARRRDAPATDRGLPPPYFNDVLNAVDATEEPVQVQAALWRHEVNDGVAYLPSSSIQRDVARSLDWYDKREAFAWAQCLLWALDDLSHQRPDLTDVVLDLPPGTWGFSHETMVLVSMLGIGQPFPEGCPAWHEGTTRWFVNPFLITSADGNDLLPALEYIGRNQRKRLSLLRPLANRATEGIDVVRRRARSLLGPAFAALGAEDTLDLVPEVGVLGKVFREGDMLLNKDVLALKKVLRIEVSR